MSRDGRIDIAKALAIILVVLGHSLEAPVEWQQYLRNYVVSFHLSLFFFLSGWFLDIQDIASKLHFIARKVKGLWLPYVKWMFAFIVLHNIFCKLHCYGSFRGGQMPGTCSIIEIAENLIMSLTFRGNNQLLGGFWFIPTLFYASIMSLFAVWFIKILPPPPPPLFFCIYARQEHAGFNSYTWLP